MRRWHQFFTAIAILVLSIAADVVPCPSCGASGFPGPGSAADWSDALPHYNLGNKYLNEGRYDDAARKFRDAIDRYRFDPDFYVNLGVASQKLGDYSSAEQSFRQAVELNDKDWSAWMDLGNAYLKQNRLKEALSTFEHTLKLNPPAADTKFLKDDISDIHKVLRNLGQEPMPGAAPAKVPAKSSGLAVKKKLAPARSNTLPPTPPIKDWGY